MMTAEHKHLNETSLQELPSFDGRLHLSQSYPSGDWMLWLILVSACLFAMLPMAISAYFFGADSADFPGLGTIVLSVLMFLVGVFVPFLIEQLLSPGKNVMGNSQVKIDRQGIEIAELGKLNWQNILSIEGIPDCSYAIIVHTANMGSLLLTDTPEMISDHILPALNAHLLGNKGVGSVSGAVSIYRVVPFAWTYFRTLIITGYLLGGLAGIAAVVGGNTAFKSVVGLFLFPPMIAYLIWMPAFSLLSLGSEKKVSVLTIDEERLVSMDGKINIELKNASFKLRSVSGIGYSFEFATLSSTHGKRVYFVPYDNSWEQFVSRLNSICKPTISGR